MLGPYLKGFFRFFLSIFGVKYCPSCDGRLPHRCRWRCDRCKCFWACPDKHEVNKL